MGTGASSSAVGARERAVMQTVAAAELIKVNGDPDEASAAFVTNEMRAQGIRPITDDQEGGTRCPECGAALVNAPNEGKRVIVCSQALGGEEATCSYYRAAPKDENAISKTSTGNTKAKSKK